MQTVSPDTVLVFAEPIIPLMLMTLNRHVKVFASVAHETLVFAQRRRHSAEGYHFMQR